jgi:tetratricopeptide (TPR) repeat protein
VKSVRIGLLILSFIAAGACLAANPHDSYVNWLPTGKLIVGDPQSEPAYEYARHGSKEEFTVRPRQTRFGALDVNLVLVIERKCEGETPVSIALDGTEAGASGLGSGDEILVYVAPRHLTRAENGESLKDKIRVALTSTDAYASRPATIRMYLTRDWTILGADYEGFQPPAAASPDYGIGLDEQVSARHYIEGLLAEFRGDLDSARRSYRSAMDRPGFRSRIPELASRRICYCDIAVRARGIRYDAPDVHFQIGRLCMYDGFYELAADQLRLATQEDPGNGEAWYLYADSLGYAYGESGEKIGEMIPYFEKAAAAYGREPNVWDVYVGIYTRMFVDEVGEDGKPTGGRKLMEMSPENVEKIKRNWDWMSTILWAASRGSFKLNNHYVVVDQEVYVNDYEGYFDKLFAPGDYDVFVKFYEGGPSGACGVDCGPNHTAHVEIGTWCDWEVYLHEFNHTIDWAMITSEVGLGVPVTHASDWCGWQPIPTMGCGHRSLNHYYMTPGMFEVIQGAEPPTSNYIREWLVSGPYSCRPREGLDTKYTRQEGRVVPAMTEKESGLWKWVLAEGPWVDLTGLAREAAGRTGRPTESVVAYAHCYVFCPSSCKVRMWLGMNDAARVWINGELVHKGVYAAICNWDEADEVDQLACGVTLSEGWNSVMVKVENYPKTPEELAAAGATENRWGFSLRFTDMHNRAMEGMETRFLRPKNWEYPRRVSTAQPTYHNWWDVRDDYTSKLPQLTTADLRRLIGLPAVEITADGVVRLSRNGREPSREMGMPVRYYYDPNDITVDNELNWPREYAAVVRYPVYTKASKSSPEVREWHDLVFLRPEAFDLFLTMMPLPEDAESRYGIKSHADRVIGYVLVDRDDCPNGRVMLVVDTYLGEKLPEFEWDVLDLNRAWGD